MEKNNARRPTWPGASKSLPKWLFQCHEPKARLGEIRRLKPEQLKLKAKKLYALLNATSYVHDRLIDEKIHELTFKMGHFLLDAEKNAQILPEHGPRIIFEAENALKTIYQLMHQLKYAKK